MKRFVLIVILTLSVSMGYSQTADLSNWSFTAELGLKNSDKYGDATIQPTFGASAEYALSPVVGLSVDYYHFTLSGGTFKTQLHASDVNLTVNFNRLLLPQNENKIIFNGSLGYGLARYTTKYPVISDSYSAYHLASSFPVVALSVEYYFVENIAAGAKVQYRPFNKNDLEGDPKINFTGYKNDNLVAVTLYLRLRLRAAD
ncbi:MAG TPA: hypothetical protein VJ602_05320 [Paludibacter sp.]|nr:hypothetical protein [Paludibacter sp.]